MMSKEHYERTRPYQEMITLYQSSRAMTSNEGMDELGAIYAEMGYAYKPNCAGCKHTMMDDLFNWITKYELTN